MQGSYQEESWMTALCLALPEDAWSWSRNQVFFQYIMAVQLFYFQFLLVRTWIKKNWGVLVIRSFYILCEHPQKDKSSDDLLHYISLVVQIMLWYSPVNENACVSVFIIITTCWCRFHYMWHSTRLWCYYHRHRSLSSKTLALELSEILQFTLFRTGAHWMSNIVCSLVRVFLNV